MATRKSATTKKKAAARKPAAKKKSAVKRRTSVRRNSKARQRALDTAVMAGGSAGSGLAPSAGSTIRRETAKPAPKKKTVTKRKAAPKKKSLAQRLRKFVEKQLG